jgi:hypothetical protein
MHAHVKSTRGHVLKQAPLRNCGLIRELHNQLPAVTARGQLNQHRVQTRI